MTAKAFGLVKAKERLRTLFHKRKKNINCTVATVTIPKIFYILDNVIEIVPVGGNVGVYVGIGVGVSVGVTVGLTVGVADGETRI